MEDKDSLEDFALDNNLDTLDYSLEVLSDIANQLHSQTGELQYITGSQLQNNNYHENDQNFHSNNIIQTHEENWKLYSRTEEAAPCPANGYGNVFSTFSNGNFGLGTQNGISLDEKLMADESINNYSTGCSSTLRDGPAQHNFSSCVMSCASEVVCNRTKTCSSYIPCDDKTGYTTVINDFGETFSQCLVSALSVAYDLPANVSGDASTVTEYQVVTPSCLNEEDLGKDNEEVKIIDQNNGSLMENSCEVKTHTELVPMKRHIDTGSEYQLKTESPTIQAAKTSKNHTAPTGKSSKNEEMSKREIINFTSNENTDASLESVEVSDPTSTGHYFGPKISRKMRK